MSNSPWPSYAPDLTPDRPVPPATGPEPGRRRSVLRAMWWGNTAVIGLALLLAAGLAVLLFIGLAFMEDVQESSTRETVTVLVASGLVGAALAALGCVVARVVAVRAATSTTLRNLPAWAVGLLASASGVLTLILLVLLLGIALGL